MKNNLKAVLVLAPLALCCLVPIANCFGGDIQLDYMTVHKRYEPGTCLDTETQQELDKCTTTSLKKSQKKMKDIFYQIKEEYKKNEPKLVKPFLKAQNSWNEYVETECNFSTYYSWGGSAYQSILNKCFEKKILERISYLEWIKSNP